MSRLFLFLSSPCDCGQERDLVRKVISKINADPTFRRDGISIVIEESDGVPFSSNTSPQQGVNTYRKTPDECDLFVCIFRNRFGSPPESSLTKTDGTPCQSGTEYEFYRALNQTEVTPHLPHMLTYRYAGPADVRDEVEQLQKIEEFFTKAPFVDDNGRCTGGYHVYHNLDEFADSIERHLREYLAHDYWFDSWMSSQCERFVNDAGPRYSKDAHVETDIMAPFDQLLRSEKTFRKLDDTLAETYNKIPSSDPSLQELIQEFDQLAHRFSEIEVWKDGLPLVESKRLLSKAKGYIEAELETQQKVFDDLRRSQKEEKPSQEHLCVKAYLSQLEDASYQIRASYSTVESLQASAQRVLLLTGEAGIGKTHTLVEEVSRCVDDGGIAVGVFGHKLRNVSAIRPDLLKQLDCPNINTFADLLALLDRKARERKCVALLAIDALNETVPRTIWQDELAGLLEEALKYPQIAIAMTVRSDYESITLPTNENHWHRIEHRGFAGVEPEALQTFFNAYSINAPIYPPILPEFSNPLYLKLLCKTLQAQAKNDYLLPVPSWLDVHHEWVSEVQKKAKRSEELQLDQRRNDHVSRFINKFSDYVLDNNGAVARDIAEEIAHSIAGERASHFVSFFLSEQILFDSWDEVSSSETISFGYERSSDTFLAERLLKKTFKNKLCVETLTEAFAAEGALRVYVATGGNPVPINRNGILRALMLLVPKQLGKELPDLLFEEGLRESSIARAWFDSLLWRTQSDDFGGDFDHLWALANKMRPHAISRAVDELDIWIRLALVANHPFSMGNLLHPWLKKLTMAERDSKWTVSLIPLWADDQSTLRNAVQWAAKANRVGINCDIAWPLSLLLCWCCTSSNTGLRQSAAQGLCRILTVCPEITEELLQEFAECDDPYIVEMLLSAVLGATLNSNDKPWIRRIGQTVYDHHFVKGNAKWCHLHIRYFAQRIVTHAKGFAELEKCIIPPFGSNLPLDETPSKKQLRNDAENVRGQLSIVWSSMDDDFFRYILDANSGSIPFSSSPLPNSSEIERPLLGTDRPAIGYGRTKPEVFDISLAGRFVAWNCLKLGWSEERFGRFDDSHWITTDRIVHGEKTERIGKKYQWIGWRTLQAFLSDNYYVTRRFHRDELLEYQEPKDIDESVIDPLLWLHTDHVDLKEEAPFPLSTPWPDLTKKSIQEWYGNPGKEPSFVKAVCAVPDEVQLVAPGSWLKMTLSHTWEPGWCPGRWEQRSKSTYDTYRTVWLMAWVKIVKKADAEKFQRGKVDISVLDELKGNGRADYPHLEHISLDQWATHSASEVDGFKSESGDQYFDSWPVDYAEMLASNGMDNAFTLPTPWLVRKWNLSLDLTTGIYSLPDGRPLLMNTYFRGGRDAVFAHQSTLREKLDEFGWELTWFVRSEQMACLDHHNFTRAVSMFGLAGLERNEIKMWWKGYDNIENGS